MRQTIRRPALPPAISFLAAAAAVLVSGIDRPAAAGAKQQSTPPGPDREQILKTFVAEFVEITPGRGKFPRSFEMGSADGPKSERPVRKVTFGYNFAIARHEVTQELYEAVMGNNPSVWQGPTRGRNAVEMVTWREAVEFCRRLTKLLREAKLIGPGDEIRLPSEAEWEYCCRAGTKGPFSFDRTPTRPGDRGHTARELDRYAWHTGNAAGNDPAVGALKPNPWGLYDMHGYLWEYVSDAWHGDYDEAPSDGTAWDADETHVPRVIRGGSWRDRYEHLRSSARWSVPDHARSDAIGFRCVLAKIGK